MLVLRLLGGPSLCGNPSTLAGPAMQRHRLALLALLASSRFRPQSRDKLAVANDAAVPELDDAIGVPRDLGVVRDQMTV